MKAILYGRVSTTEQKMKGYSLPEQFRECRKKAADLGISDLVELQDDESGTLHHRQGLDEARELIRHGGIDYFICLHPDRFARNVAAQAVTFDEMQRHGVKVVFTQVAFEDSPEGRFFFNVAAAISQLESEKIRERTMRGKRGAMRQGRIPRGFNLYGYTYQVEKGALAINEEQAKWVRRIYEWLSVESLSIIAVTDRLNEMGVPAPKGRAWYRNTVRRLAHNHAYTGKLILNRYNSEGYAVHKKPVTFRDESEWFVIDIPPVIDEDLYEATQKAIARWAHTRERRTPNGGHLLSGMLRCGRCHVHFRYRRSTRGVQYVTCSLRFGDADFAPGRRAQRCTINSIRASAIEAHVWETVRQWVLDPEEIRTAVERRQTGKARTAFADELQQVTSQMGTATQERDNLVYLFTKGLTDAKKAETELEALRARIARLEKRQKELTRLATAETAADKAFTLADALNEYREELDNLDLEGQKFVVRRLVDKVIIHGMTPEEWEVLPHMD